MTEWLYTAVMLWISVDAFGLGILMGFLWMKIF